MLFELYSLVYHYRIANKVAPISLVNAATNPTLVHNYSTRQQNIYNFGYLHHLAEIWNRIPRSIAESHTITRLKRTFKNYTLFDKIPI